MTPKTKVAILISGRGSNMASLAAAASERDFPVEIVGVLSDRADAAGLAAAGSAGIATRVLERTDHDGTEAHELAIDAALNALGAEIVCLAGYMRVLSPAFVGQWRGRLINVHPSLLPLYKGLDTHRRALADGVRIHGCSVHFVTPTLDGGPIIAQAAVPVLTDDTEATLAARVLKAEHRLYPTALKLLAQGKVRLEGDRAVFAAEDVVEAPAASFIQSPVSTRGELDVQALARVTP